MRTLKFFALFLLAFHINNSNCFSQVDTSIYIQIGGDIEQTRVKLKKPDTTPVSVKIFDSLGYLRRIAAYKIVYSRIIWNPMMTGMINGNRITDYSYEYFYLDFTPIDKKDLEEDYSSFKVLRN